MLWTLIRAGLVVLWISLFLYAGHCDKVMRRHFLRGPPYHRAKENLDETGQLYLRRAYQTGGLFFLSIMLALILRSFLAR